MIQGISFAAEPGRMTALVGPSGGGKSTVFNLMLRFYELDSGSIRIDGQKSRTCRAARCANRSPMSARTCSCSTARSATTSRIGKPDASEQEIVAAAKAAHAHEFITAFPTGYDTPVGERGRSFPAASGSASRSRAR